MRPNHRFVALVTGIGMLAGLTLGSAAAAAGPADPGAGSWTLRGFGAWVNTTGDRLRSGPPIDNFAPVVEFSLTLDDGTGAGLALEYRATRRLGIEALAILADLDATFRLRTLAPVALEEQETRDLGTDLLGVGLNVHLTPGRRIDLYAGPLIALVRYDDFRSDLEAGSLQAEFDDDTALGVTLGADIALGNSGKWACSLALRRLWSSTEVVDSIFELDVDPLIASAGIAYRWGGH